MTIKSALQFLLCMLWLSSCRNQPPVLSARIVQVIRMDTLPSASGLEWASGQWYIISDDAPYIYTLSGGLDSGGSISLHPGLTFQGRRMPKSIKRDLECLACIPSGGDTLLLALASGSKSPWRDSALLLNPARPEMPRWYSLRPFYDALIRQHQIENGKLNIEGATLLSNHLLILNRGDNTIYSVPVQPFLDYLRQGGSAAPAANATPFKLPVQQGLQARLSGAAVITGTDSLILCASLEDTPSATADGPVLGSFIGLSSKAGPGQTAWAPVLHADGSMPKEKIESVAFAGYWPDGALKVLAAVDNDDGSSALLLLRLLQQP